MAETYQTLLMVFEVHDFLFQSFFSAPLTQQPTKLGVSKRFTRRAAFEKI